MGSTRFVKQSAEGSWDVLRAGDPRALVHLPTQRQAMRRARAMLQKVGGGDVVVLDQDGNLIELDHVARPNGPRGRGD